MTAAAGDRADVLFRRTAARHRPVRSYSPVTTGMVCLLLLSPSGPAAVVTCIRTRTEQPPCQIGMRQDLRRHTWRTPARKRPWRAELSAADTLHEWHNCFCHLSSAWRCFVTEWNTDALPFCLRPPSSSIERSNNQPPARVELELRVLLP